MIFNFDKEEVFTQTIEVADSGNFALECLSEANFCYYYIVVKTIMGKTAILKFGPVAPDLGALTEEYSLLYKVINYKEITINKEVNAFINDPKKKITRVEEAEIGDVLEQAIEITEDNILV